MKKILTVIMFLFIASLSSWLSGNDFFEEQLAWSSAKNIDTIEAYEDFMKKYPRSQWIDRFGGVISHIYRKYEEIGTIEAYREFIEKYPDSSEAIVAKYEIDELKRQEEKQKGDEFDYRKAMLQQYDLNQSIIFKGIVIQLIEGNMLITTKITKGIYEVKFEDPVWVESDKPVALEGELVKITGEYIGITSYETVIEGTKTVPAVRVIDCELLESRENVEATLELIDMGIY